MGLRALSLLRSFLAVRLANGPRADARGFMLSPHPRLGWLRFLP